MFVGFLFAASASAQEVTPQNFERQQVPVSTGTLVQPAARNVPAATTPRREQQVHTVWLWQETRDCLWNLAKKYYGDPWSWKKIYLANRYQIADPGVIYPKQVLVIPSPDDSER